MTKQQIETQIKVIERLLDEQPKMIGDGRWNPKWFSLDGKLKKLRRQLSEIPSSNLCQSWNDFLSK